MRSWAIAALLLLTIATGTAAGGEVVKLQELPTDELLALLATPYAELPAAHKEEEDLYGEICAVLLARREVSVLLDGLAHCPGTAGRDYLVSRVLYHIQDAAIADAFEKRLGEGESEEDYYIANYLAKSGNRRPLEVLNRHYFRYPVSSWQWSYTAALFGKYGYRPAIPNLIWSLDAASLNLVGEAWGSLKLLYPDSPREFESPSAAKSYFQERFTAEANRLGDQTPARSAPGENGRH